MIFSGWRQKYKSNKVLHFLKVISESATLALFLSVVFFSYEMINNMEESKDVTENLVKIQNSLTTKYLGIFPDYVPAINELFSNASPGDSIIIFEDVLYYGIKSRPAEYRSFNEHLLELRNRGSNVIVAYYSPNSLVFHKMIQEGRFPTYIRDMHLERKDILDSIHNLHDIAHKDIIYVDSLLSEKYFSQERWNDMDKFAEQVEEYLQPLHTDDEERKTTRAEQDVNKMCYNIDSIKHYYLNKNVEEITYRDFEDMYKAITNEMEKLYTNYGFELIPLDDYLTMSCWLSGNEMIFAFPSKYNTDEIGFSSQDPAFSKYVYTMLQGVRR